MVDMQSKHYLQSSPGPLSSVCMEFVHLSCSVSVLIVWPQRQVGFAEWENGEDWKCCVSNEQHAEYAEGNFHMSYRDKVNVLAVTMKNSLLSYLIVTVPGWSKQKKDGTRSCLSADEGHLGSRWTRGPNWGGPWAGARSDETSGSHKEVRRKL